MSKDQEAIVLAGPVAGGYKDSVRKVEKSDWQRLSASGARSPVAGLPSGSESGTEDGARIIA
jgi:hypothetical protein